MLLSCCLIACQNADTSATSSTTTETETPKAERPAPKPKAANVTSYLETSIGKIPVHSSFEGIESIFEQKNDTTYIVNFWATWCKPCVKELPYFEELQEKYKGEKVQVVLVSLDFKRQLEKKLKPFLEERQLQSRVVVLTDNKYNDWIGDVDTEWTGAIPVTIVYNAKGREFVGEQVADFAELESIMKRVQAS